MFFAYGNYHHQVGGCNISIDRPPIKNAAKVSVAVLEVWSIQGMLTSQAQNGPVDIDSQIAALMAAYSVDGQDLILYMPDGVTPSSSQLISAKTLGGTRVSQQPSFPTSANAERVAFATFALKVEAEIPVDATKPILVDYHESLKFKGGIPLVGYLEPAVGIAEPQIWKQSPTFKATQEGHATGYNWQPVVGLDVGVPIWPGSLVGQPDFGAESPDRIGTAYKDYAVSWRYDFESIAPLTGAPTPWPANF
jgi:hypothetical protein